MTIRRPLTLARATAAAAAAAAALLLPLSAAPANAAAAPAAALPPGVIHLEDSEPCPPATLCLYRDYGRQGPAYGIGAGYYVDLRRLPMPGGVGGPSAADNVSSWVNNTGYAALLIDEEDQQDRPLFPGQYLEEPPPTNDTVDVVRWL
ncbi:peptidase inhibitor family I36 protein [Streptomyces sp. NPDC058755]|uniref:peptidase inhibitor family I36 protein n=1 Tax=unclassified Streptomyces TaxID=2593676 RepID=UPI003680F1F3